MAIIRPALACDAGYYLDENNECMGCEAGYYCPGDDTRYECPSVQDFCDAAAAAELDLVKIRCHLYSWGNTVNGVTQPGTSIQNCRARPEITTNCGRYYYSVTYDTTTQSYPFNNNTIKYWQDNIQTGHYFSDQFDNVSGKYRYCNDCTNAPVNAHYTGAGTPDVGDCPWACDNGYSQSGDTCVANTLRITWNGVDAADVTANNAETMTYGENIRTPRVAPAPRPGQVFLGWKFYAALPSGYTRLKYIESTGTQWIDTGINTPTSTSTVTRFEGVAAYTSTTGRQFIAGYAYFYVGHYCEFRSNKFGFNNNGYANADGTDGYITATLTKNTPYALSMQIDGSSNTTFNITVDSTTHSYTTPRYQSTEMGKFYLFALTSSNIAKGLRLYSAKITIDNALVRNMIPARRDSDGVLGMYDTVTNTFFTNAGTGTFVAGPEIGNLPQ